MTTADPEPSPSDSTERGTLEGGSSRQRRRLRDVSKATIATATAMVALTAAAVGLIFDLWPGLSPEPGTHRGAELSVLAVERNVSYGEWLRRSSGTEQIYKTRLRQQLRGAESDAGLRIPGELAYVKVSIFGFKHGSVTLRPSVYYASSQERKPLGGQLEQGGQSLVHLNAPIDEFVAEIWIPPVRGAGRYFVRIEARDTSGTLLAVADSSPFLGLSP
jgi:hypothetical protein